MDYLIMYTNNILDINECAVETASCPEHSESNNTIGGYNCDCVSGYEKDGATCVGNVSLILSNDKIINEDYLQISMSVQNE